MKRLVLAIGLSFFCVGAFAANLPPVEQVHKTCTSPLSVEDRISQLVSEGWTVLRNDGEVSKTRQAIFFIGNVYSTATLEEASETLDWAIRLAGDVGYSFGVALEKDQTVVTVGTNSADMPTCLVVQEAPTSKDFYLREQFTVATDTPTIWRAATKINKTRISVHVADETWLEQINVPFSYRMTATYVTRHQP